MRVRHRLRLLAVLVALGLGGGLTLVGLGQAVATPGDVKTRVNNYWEAASIRPTTSAVRFS
ncbi:hypothetical protein K8O93_17895 [Gordonia bronchialis]|uniref:hypothetical protein n=1 Tax=Gordonia bronchialis TaxID=2054 RepID=UPI001CBE2281|nr:hypothetical protein [Gordonia bronchialis]UAK37038.1 hypothetical protein K8O93_17895 [Gordonia bronchialis]